MLLTPCFITIPDTTIVDLQPFGIETLRYRLTGEFLVQADPRSTLLSQTYLGFHLIQILLQFALLRTGMMRRVFTLLNMADEGAQMSDVSGRVLNGIYPTDFAPPPSYM